MEYNQQKLSLIRKYPLETLVAFLFLSILVLCKWINGIQKDVNENASKLEQYLKTDNGAMIKALENNTAVLKETKEALIIYKKQ